MTFHKNSTLVKNESLPSSGNQFISSRVGARISGMELFRLKYLFHYYALKGDEVTSFMINTQIHRLLKSQMLAAKYSHLLQCVFCHHFNSKKYVSQHEELLLTCKDSVLVLTPLCIIVHEMKSST